MDNTKCLLFYVWILLDYYKSLFFNMNLCKNVFYRYCKISLIILADFKLEYLISLFYVKFIPASGWSLFFPKKSPTFKSMLNITPVFAINHPVALIKLINNKIFVLWNTCLSRNIFILTLSVPQFSSCRYDNVSVTVSCFNHIIVLSYIFFLILILIFWFSLSVNDLLSIFIRLFSSFSELESLLIQCRQQTLLMQ